jgi:hypothetical protein
MTEMLEDNPDIDLAVVDVDTNIEWVEVLIFVEDFNLIARKYF